VHVEVPAEEYIHQEPARRRAQQQAAAPQVSVSHLIHPLKNDLFT